jgi:hypothetical protein
VDSTPNVSRRTVLASAGAVATAAAALEMTGAISVVPRRAWADTQAAATIPDIQFDNGAFSAPPQTSDTGVVFGMPPVHTIFLTARLLRQPTVADQTELQRTLAALETAYPWGASNLFTFISYGLPYFRRFPAALTSSRIPKLRSNTSRSVLEEAVPSPTDIHPSNPGITKVRFNVPVVIEQNDLLFTLRSDNPQFLNEVLAWFNGNNSLRGQSVRSPAFGGLLTFTSSRNMFVQIGLPAAVARQNNLPFANFIQHQSPMWMGFADQQTNAAGPAPVCTFAGNNSSRLTTAVPGDYFDNGAIQHLAHDILDMLQFYDMDTAASPAGPDGVFTERVQYMFHSPAINPGFGDQYTDGGGPAFLTNENRGPNYAAQTAQGIGVQDAAHRLGHVSTLQRSSRATDGTPVHIRMDGPGFDNMDVPDGSSQPKLQFTIFVPTSDFFTTMRRNQASLDLAQRFAVPEQDNGLERFITATRRQNFLIPPRRNRAFPLAELA